MADPQNLSAVLSALAQNFRPQVVRTINRMSVILRTVPVMAGAGKNVAWDIELSGMLAEVFTDGDDATSFGVDAVTPATLSWALFRSNFRITDLAMAAAQSSLTPQSLMNLMGRNVVNSTRRLSSFVNAKVYSGTTDIVGLD